MTTMTLERETFTVPLISEETARRALRWLKAQDGGGMTGERAYRLRQFRPTGNERVERIAEVLAYAQHEKKTGGKTFDMGDWHTGTPVVKKTAAVPPPLPCGSACCLAGTAAAFYMPVGYKMNGENVYYRNGSYWRDTEDVGRDELGLSRNQADFVFYMTSRKLPTIQLVLSYMTGHELAGDLSRFLNVAAMAS